jgi:ADP-heptose:LPS heptosyltransferase
MAAARFPILFFAPAAPADAIFASGLIAKLHDEAPNASFTVVASAQAAPLFRCTPRLERLMVLPGEGRLERFRLWRRLRGRRWGLVLDAAGTGLGRWLRARQRAGPPAAGAAPEHEVVRAARLLKLEGEPPPPRIFADGQARARASALLGGAGPLLAVAPGAAWVGGAWPVERFARAASTLISAPPLRGARLMIVGGPADAAVARALTKTLPKERCIDLTAEADPLVTYACLERAALFIGNAGWATHLAAAAGAPTLGLYGPQDEAVEGPWGPLARAVRGPRTVREIRQIDPGLSQPVCHMLDLPVDTVVDRARRLLKEALQHKERPA